MDRIDYDALAAHLMDFRKKYPTSNIDFETWTNNNEDLVGVLTTHLPKRDRFTEWLSRRMSWVIRFWGKFHKVSRISSSISAI